MATIMNFIFDNILLVLLAFVVYYIYHTYKTLKELTIKINYTFSNGLDDYIKTKIKEVTDLANRLSKEHEGEVIVTNETTRLMTMIKQGKAELINDKVEISNAINRFKLSKNIDFEKYPYLKELEKIGIFNDEDMESVDNGIAIARREYNAQAFRYNEKTSSSIVQFLTKITNFPAKYLTFEKTKSMTYQEDYEVFDEEEPEINTLASLNYVHKKTIEEKKVVEDKRNDGIITEEDLPQEITIEHTDNVIKPSIEIDAYSSTALEKKKEKQIKIDSE